MRAPPAPSLCATMRPTPSVEPVMRTVLPCRSMVGLQTVVDNRWDAGGGVTSSNLILDERTCSGRAEPAAEADQSGARLCPLPCCLPGRFAGAGVLGCCLRPGG